MKTVFTYVVLIALGYGLGTFVKEQYQKHQQEESLEENMASVESRELTDEEETQYRRAHNAALSLRQEHQLPSALKNVESMLELAPHRVEAHVLYAETSLELMRWVRGVEVVSGDVANIEVIENHVDKANFLAPNDFEVLKLNIHYKDWLGLVSRHLGDEENSLKYLQSALDVLTETTKLWGHDQKKFANLLLEKINLLRHMNRFDEALEKLEIALTNKELQFMLGQLYFNKALIHISREEQDLAVKNFEIALESEGAPTELIYLHRAEFYQDQGYLDLALDDYEKLKNIHPNDQHIQDKIKEIKNKIS